MMIEVKEGVKEEVKEEIKKEVKEEIDFNTIRPESTVYSYIENLHTRIERSDREISYLKTKEKIIWGVLIIQFIASLCLFII